MALKPCRECKVEVSTGAKNCPHCGVKWPTASGGMRWDRLAIVVVIVLAIGYLSRAANNEGGSASANEKANPTCVSDWTKCKDNSDLANNWKDYHWNVASACKQEADGRAKYGNPKWSWYSFGSFLPGDSAAKKGVISAVDNDVQFQNGFGAYARVKVVCEYDLRQKKVLNVSIIDR
jgi:RNA polymerase subunit RPABC4/transcription elongation factor Spt4